MSAVTYTVELYGTVHQPDGWWHLRHLDCGGIALAQRRARSVSLCQQGTLVRVTSDMSHTPFAVYLAGREVRCSDV